MKTKFVQFNATNMTLINSSSVSFNSSKKFLDLRILFLKKKKKYFEAHDLFPRI